MRVQWGGGHSGDFSNIIPPKKKKKFSFNIFNPCNTDVLINININFWSQSSNFNVPNIFFFLIPGWRRRRKSRRPRDVTASGRRAHPPAWAGHGLTTITTITTINRRTRPLGRRPCSCSAPTTLSAGTPGSSSNGHILLKHIARI